MVAYCPKGMDSVCVADIGAGRAIRRMSGSGVSWSDVQWCQAAARLTGDGGTVTAR